MFAMIVALVVAAAALSMIVDVYQYAMNLTDPPEMRKQPRPQIPADDLIGKELRDVQ